MSGDDALNDEEIRQRPDDDELKISISQVVRLKMQVKLLERCVRFAHPRLTGDVRTSSISDWWKLVRDAGVDLG